MSICPTMRVKRKSDGAEAVINIEDFNEKDFEEIVAKAPAAASEPAAGGDDAPAGGEGGDDAKAATAVSGDAKTGSSKPAARKK